MADARLGAQSSEALTDGVPERRLAAVSAEALSTNGAAPERRLAAVSMESLTNAANDTPERRLAALSVEVLVPVRLTFVGWGIPVKSNTWS